jgi:serine/threonine protein kinase
MPDPANDQNREPLLRLVEQRGTIGPFASIRRWGTDGGGGCFSLVFEALDTRTGEPAILKAFHPMERSDPYRWACFQRECAILQRLSGEPDIVRCLGPHDEFVEVVQTAVGPWTIPFAYVPLERARSDVQQEILSGPIEPLRALDIFRVMARAVQRLHARNIAHRDIKPGNFLIAQRGDVKLSDFGTARDLRDGSPVLPRYDRWPGDTTYTSPEILAGLHSEAPELAFGADFYALGCTLFELFAGAPLAVHVFDAAFVGNISLLNVAPPRDRRRLFERLIPFISSTRRLPSVRQTGRRVPGSVSHRIDALYRGMSALDHRVRVHDFDFVFRQIDICALVLRNQAKYDAWRAERRRRRLVRETRQAARLVML